MALEPFTLSAIQGGAVAEKLDQTLAEISRDVGARPNNKAPRKVTLQITIVPVIDSMTCKNFPDVACKISTSIPGEKFQRNSNLEGPSAGLVQWRPCGEMVMGGARAIVVLSGGPGGASGPGVSVQSGPGLDRCVRESAGSSSTSKNLMRVTAFMK